MGVRTRVSDDQGLAIDFSPQALEGDGREVSWRRRCSVTLT
jgi:hypothetical protein